MEKHASQPESGRIGAGAADRLDSWKEIASYLKRDVTTVQRWERREAMPVHRHLHGKLGSVYAFRSDLDAWQRARRPHAHDSPATTQTSGRQSETDESRGTRPELQPAGRSGRRDARTWSARVAVFSSVFAAGFLAHIVWVTVAEQSTASLTRPPPIERIGVSGPDADPADHEYQVGRRYLWRFDEENLKLAIHHFERATQIDPTHAAAFAALSNAWWARGMFGSIGLRAAEAPARRAAQASLTLDNRLAAAYVAQADVKRLFDKDPWAAEQMVTRALALAPDSVEAHHSFALLLMALGRFAEAIAHVQYAATLDPLAPAVQSNFGRILYRAGRFEEAVSRLERALELEPGMRGHYNRLGDVYGELGQYERALEAYDRSGIRGPAHQARVARILARMGRSRDARLLLENLADDQVELALWEVAAASLALGDTNGASSLLARMIERDDPGLPYFPVDPQFVSLRTMPQWPVLLQRAGFSIANSPGRSSLP
jgi:tetratricopeptide (TPR) repeat protein